jgi:hypothetical protein
MWEWINRVQGRTRVQLSPLTELYGTEAWKGYAELPKANQKSFLYDLYESHAAKGGREACDAFRSCSRANDTSTQFFFATKHPKGMDLMKAFNLEGRQNWQTTNSEARDESELMLDIDQPKPRALSKARSRQRLLVPTFSIEEVTEWGDGRRVRIYHRGHVKSALKALEARGNRIRT